MNKILDHKLNKLEAIRGFAAVYVVLHHVFSKPILVGGKNIAAIFLFGQEAVILFFILSGFVIQYACAHSEDKSFRTFFLKRLLRIYIPLVLVFIANYLLISIDKGDFPAIDWWTFTGNLFMLQDMLLLKPHVICEPFLNNIPLWSLSYEWWFYMLFFFIGYQFKGKSHMVVYLGGIVAALTLLLYPNFINRELMYLTIWWTGADLAKLYINKKEITISTMRGPLMALAVIILILTVNVGLSDSPVIFGSSPFLELRHFLFAFTAVLLAILWKKFKWIGFNKTLGVFAYIAPISFGIYISHWFFIDQAHYFDDIIGNVYIRFALYVSTCLLFSYLAERVIYLRLNLWIRSKMAVSHVKTPRNLLHDNRRLRKEIYLQPTMNLEK